jgi:uncharacterized protein (TIGR03437 family)
MKFLLLLSVSLCAYAQQPAIQSVRNAASGVPSNVVPQMLVSIHGTSLASVAESARDVPLPRSMQGTSVAFNGIDAPLLYVSPAQINAQVPSVIPASGAVTVVVKRNGVSSPPFTVIAGPDGAFGVFTADSTGCGQGSVLNIRRDGSMTINSPQNSFDPITDYGFAIYTTGMGMFWSRSDGTPWKFDASEDLHDRYYATVGIVPGTNHPTKGLTATYAGPAPGLVGAEQVNVLNTTGPPEYVLPTPEGCRVPLVLSGNDIFGAENGAFKSDVLIRKNASQYFNVSIHSGGGACVDPPSRSMGVIQWNRTAKQAGTTAAFSMQFLEGPEIGFPGKPFPSMFTDHGYASPWPPAASCAASYPKTLEAGQVTITGAGIEPVILQKSIDNGMTSYRSPLPEAVPPGGYSVTVAGLTSGVGAFNVRADVPDPISITNDLRSGGSIPLPFTLNWTGGDARSVVTMELIATVPGEPARVLDATTLASAGTRTLALPSPTIPYLFPRGTAVKLTVTQTPADSPSLLFSASGLTLGGAQTWKYVFEFDGLRSEP